MRFEWLSPVAGWAHLSGGVDSLKRPPFSDERLLKIPSLCSFLSLFDDWFLSLLRTGRSRFALSTLTPLFEELWRHQNAGYQGLLVDGRIIDDVL